MTTPNRYELLRNMILGHQYGLRGFGDGSLSRGRDLTTDEQQTITEALKTAAWRDTEIARLQAQVDALAGALIAIRAECAAFIEAKPARGPDWVVVTVDAALAAAGR